MHLEPDEYQAFQSFRQALQHLEAVLSARLGPPPSHLRLCRQEDAGEEAPARKTRRQKVAR